MWGQYVVVWINDFTEVLQAHKIGRVMMKHEHTVRLRLNQRAGSRESHNQW